MSRTKTSYLYSIIKIDDELVFVTKSDVNNHFGSPLVNHKVLHSQKIYKLTKNTIKNSIIIEPPTSVLIRNNYNLKKSLIFDIQMERLADYIKNEKTNQKRLNWFNDIYINTKTIYICCRKRT